MRSLLPRSLLAAVLLLAPMAAGAQAFLGGHNRVETVLVDPTPTAYVVPTSDLVSTSYLLPSSYVVPTVYGTSYSYLTPTYYLSPSAYVVPSYRATRYYVPRRYAARPIVTTTRTYSPTLFATTWDYPIVATSATIGVTDCDTTAPVVSSAPSAPPARTPSNGGAQERRPSSVIDSVPANEPGLSSESTQAPAADAATSSPTTPPAPSPEPGAATSPATNPPPPAAPAPAPGDELPNATSPTTSGGAAPSTPPRYNVQRPRNTDLDLRPASLARGILEGKVISADSGRPEEGVRILVSDHRGRFDDRTALTDALGRYAINLPEGDWTVRVEMPSKKTFPVSDVTVGSGRVTDPNGRIVASLTIKR